MRMMSRSLLQAMNAYARSAHCAFVAVVVSACPLTHLNSLQDCLQKGEALLDSASRAGRSSVLPTQGWRLRA